MKNRFVISVLTFVIAFPVGMFAGIRVDWSTWLAHPWWEYDYQVEPYDQANLLVEKGDYVALQPPSGTNPNLQMKFLGGDAPCPDGKPDCVINGPDTGGEYLFSCATSDNSGLQCPDPGLQQQPTNPVTPPIHSVRFLEALEVDVEHFFGPGPSRAELLQLRRIAPPTNVGASLSGVAASGLGGASYVYCNGTATAVLPRQVGKWQTSIASGQTIIWSAHDTLTFSNYSICSSAPVWNQANNTYSCTATTSASAGTYKVSAGSCSATSYESPQITVTH